MCDRFGRDNAIAFGFFTLIKFLRWFTVAYRKIGGLYIRPCEETEALGKYSAIGSTGKVGEDALKLLGGKSQQYFDTTLGGRFIDQLVNGVAHESKVGYTSLTKDIRLQIAKDVELLQTKQISGSTWHFFQSPVTGRTGPSKPLLDALQQNGIHYIIH